MQLSLHTFHTVATFCKILLQTGHRSSYVEFLRDSPYPLSLSRFSLSLSPSFSLFRDSRPPTIERRLALGQRDNVELLM